MVFSAKCWNCSDVVNRGLVFALKSGCDVITNGHDPGHVTLAGNTIDCVERGNAHAGSVGLQLLVNTPATMNVQLKVGSGSEVVTVTSEAPR